VSTDDTVEARGAADAASVAVTVVIPTLNGERYLAEVLDAVARQDFAAEVETLVIDSGSTDATLRIVRGRNGVRLHEIPNAEFGHGRTRNLGARLARGRIVVFLTQDATPADRAWLRELVAPLDEAGVEAVVGRQVPRRHAFPLQKYDILRDFLVGVIPFRDVPYSEDVAFARDVLAAGYRKAYAPRGAVRHSNDMGVREYAARMFDETIGLRRVGQAVPRYSAPAAVLRALRGSLVDTGRILRDRDYGLAERLRWLVVNPAYHFARWDGLCHGARVDLADEQRIARRSWEARQRGIR